MCDKTKQIQVVPKVVDPPYERGLQIIPDCSSTMSKSASRFVGGVYPKFIVSGKGCMVTGDDGKEYIDTIAALGPILLGHRYPAVNDAIKDQLDNSGIVFSLPHQLELEVAELLRELNPPIEMMRFCKNGTDANKAAVRLARAHSNRMGVAVARPGYHGCADWYSVGEPLNAGIPPELGKHLHSFPFNDLKALEELIKSQPDLGTVIIEQGLQEPLPGFYDGVRTICDENRMVFILDEVVTGFRWGNGGARKHYWIDPDIVCYGKGISNGMALAVVAGRRKIISRLAKDVFFSTTFGGETLSLAAAKAVMTLLKTEPVAKHIWDMGTLWMDGFNAMIKEDGGFPDLVQLHGHPPRSVLKFNDELLRAIFMQEACLRGVLFGVPIFPMYTWTSQTVDAMIKASHSALEVVAEASVSRKPEAYLKGDMPMGIAIRR